MTLVPHFSTFFRRATANEKHSHPQLQPPRRGPRVKILTLVSGPRTLGQKNDPSAFFPEGALILTLVPHFSTFFFRRATAGEKHSQPPLQPPRTGPGGMAAALPLPNVFGLLLAPTGSSWPLLAPGSSWLSLGPAGSSELILAPPGSPVSSWVFLAPFGSFWLFLAPPGPSWLLLGPLRPHWSSWLSLGHVFLYKPVVTVV